MGQILIAIVIREVTFDLKIFIAFRILLIDLISPLICKLQPGPRDAPLKCFIRRNRATQSYFLCIGVTDGMYGHSSHVSSWACTVWMCSLLMEQMFFVM